MQTATTRATPTPVLSLTAADLMSIPVRAIPEDMPLREAARLLHRADISGAPVVDSEGRCIGVLSSSDFVTWAGKDGNGTATHFVAPWGETVAIDDSSHDEIRRYMTMRPVTVAPPTLIGDLAQKMIDAHIHRVLVVDDQDRPQGIVTSTDVLAAVARAATQAAPDSERKPTKGSRARR
jgi:CBS domain-containing protein